MIQKSSFRFLRKPILFFMALMLVPGHTSAEENMSTVDVSEVKSCSLAEMNSLTPLMTKDGESQCNVAGLSRLPALLYVCEAFDNGVLTDETIVTVSEEAAAVPGPTAFVQPYEKIKAGELLKAAVMITAGDAICALAEKAAGTQHAAVAAINMRISKMGLAQNVDSAADANNSFSANDLLVIGKELAKSDSFCRFSIVFLDEIIHENGSRTELVNSNRLIRTVTGCFGIATGSSDAAQYCGIFAVKRGETAYLCTIIGAKSAQARFDAAMQMIEYAFAAYKSSPLVSAGETVAKDIPVRGGISETVELVAHEDVVILEKQGESYERKLKIPEMLTAPLHSNDSVGSLLVIEGEGKTVITVPLYPAVSVKEATVSDHIKKIMKRWVHG